MGTPDSIGGRIAAERKLRGLTQRQLATRAHVSLSLVRKVEQGDRPPTGALVTAVARALHLAQTQLTGQPYLSGDRRADAVHDPISDLRAEVLAYRLAPDQHEAAPSSLELLRHAVSEASRLRQRTDYARLGPLLPDLLRDLRAATFAHTGTDRERVMGLLAKTYDASRQFAYKLGYADLASMLADRYEWAAGQSGDPLAVAVGDTMRAADLLGAGRWSGSEQVMTDSMAALEPLGRDDIAALAVYGYLHLQAALATARAGRTEATWAHHAAAEEVATRIGTDRDDYCLAFGPTNTAIWGTALGVELLDAPAALHRAQAVHIRPDTPRERAGHHFIDVARGQLLNGDTTAALQALQEARRIAPQQTRYHPLVRDTLQALARAERRRSDSLRSLAAWVGLQD